MRITEELGYFPFSKELRKMGLSALTTAAYKKFGGLGKLREHIEKTIRTSEGRELLLFLEGYARGGETK